MDGHGHTITQACAANGVLQQDGAGALSFANVTITGGKATGDGGGIKTTTAPITLTNSTISGNTAGGAGGGISDRRGSVKVISSTISGNTAGDDAGGIDEGSGAVTVTNSTISGNTAGSDGGAIHDPGGAVTLVYSTLVQNRAATGGNLGQAKGVGASLTSFGSVVALPQGGVPNCSLVTTTSQGYNFSDDASCGFAMATDKQTAGDPGVGALSANGGPTQTRLPQTGSPLIDAIATASCQAGGAAGITTDQRALPRPSGAGCDIGAVEVQPAPITPPPAPPAAPVKAVVRFTG